MSQDEALRILERNPKGLRAIEMVKFTKCSLTNLNRALRIMIEKGEIGFEKKKIKFWNNSFRKVRVFYLK